jgi:hypothetical protein
MPAIDRTYCRNVTYCSDCASRLLSLRIMSFMVSFNGFAIEHHRCFFGQIFNSVGDPWPCPLRLREASKIVLQDMQYFMAYHYFQMKRHFLTENFIFDKSCYFELLE